MYDDERTSPTKTVQQELVIEMSTRLATANRIRAHLRLPLMRRYIPAMKPPREKRTT